MRIHSPYMVESTNVLTFSIHLLLQKVKQKLSKYDYKNPKLELMSKRFGSAAEGRRRGAKYSPKNLPLWGIFWDDRGTKSKCLRFGVG
jgi:hypothetical protein